MEVLVDAIGAVHHPYIEKARIISFVPSITELLFDLDLEEQLVGRTSFCVHPKDKIDSIPTIGGTKAANIKRIKALNATHIIVNIDENPKDMVAELQQFIPHVIVTHPNHPDDNLDLYRLLGGIFQRQQQANALCDAFIAARDELQNAVQHLPSRQVAYFIWKAPWMSVSSETYIAQMLALVKWHIVPANEKSRYPVVTWEEMEEKAELFLFSTEPYKFTQDLITQLTDPINNTEKHYTLIDGEMTSWYGSRAILGLQYLKHFALTLNNE